MSLIPELGRQRQGDLYDFEARMVYRVSFRTGSKATEKLCHGKKIHQSKAPFGSHD